MATSGAGTAGGRGHLGAIDLVRVSAVLLVIAVHTLSYGTWPTAGIGAFVMVFHSSREIFICLTAFVLTYNYRERPPSWWSFWRRRFALVLPAYLTWSVIYFLANPRPDGGPGALAALLGHEVVSGTARYHLYFLLVALQIYLAFPALRLLLERSAGHHGALFALAGGYQVAVTLAIQHHLALPGPLGLWLANPNTLLPSYLCYVVAGALAAWHLDALLALTGRRPGLVAGAFSLGVAIALAAYLLQLASGETPVLAAIVFQPSVVLESLALAWSLLALGLAWERRGSPGRRAAAAGADSSFGVYLVHPLVLQGLIGLAGVTGLQGLLLGAPTVLQLVVLLGGVVPLIYALSAGLTTIFRCSPVSLSLTGRPALLRSSVRRAPAPGGVIRPGGPLAWLRLARATSEG